MPPRVCRSRSGTEDPPQYGIVIAKGIGHLRWRLPEVLEDADIALSDSMREMLAGLGEEAWRFDARMREVGRDTAACRGRERIPGIGPNVSTALGDGLGARP